MHAKHIKSMMGCWPVNFKESPGIPSQSPLHVRTGQDNELEGEKCLVELWTVNWGTNPAVGQGSHVLHWFVFYQYAVEPPTSTVEPWARCFTQSRLFVTTARLTGVVLGGERKTLEAHLVTSDLDSVPPPFPLLHVSLQLCGQCGSLLWDAGGQEEAYITEEEGRAAVDASAQLGSASNSCLSPHTPPPPSSYESSQHFLSPSFWTVPWSG